MKVSDVMSKQVDFVTPNDRIEKAAFLIFGRGINGIPVCEKRKIVGLITENDILKKFFPTISELVEDTVRATNFEEMEEKASTILSLPVKKIMSKNPVTVKADTPLLRAQSLMNIQKVGRLPVVDDKHNLIGIISKGDVFRSLIGKQLLFSENQDYNDFLSKTYYSTVDWKNRLKYELPDLLKTFEKYNVKTVLDVGCGTGEYSIELAKRGYTVIGVDKSLPMIKESNMQKGVLPRETAENLHFWHEDIEKLLPNLDVTFDAIIFMGNTISHNPNSYLNIIKKASKYLSPNGILIFQITNFQKVIKKDKRLLHFNFTDPHDDIIKEYAFLEYYDNPLKNTTILKTFAILAFERERWKWVGIRNSLMAYMDEKIIRKILTREGFSKIEMFGASFDGKHWDYLFRKPFIPLESSWLNVLAVRK